MKIVEVNFDEIRKAMEDIRRERADYYLDRDTGEVITISGSVIDESFGYLYNGPPDDDMDADVFFDSELNTSADIPDRIMEELEQSLSVLLRPERYIRIPERDGAEAYKCMKAFAEEQAEGELKAVLLYRLRGVKAFKNFKDVLKDFRKERKLWNRYNASKMQGVIRDWLADEGIKAVRKRRRGFITCEQGTGQ